MNNPNLIQYIEQNRAQYTRAAIDKQLLDAGYSQADIDAAWKEIEAREANTPVVPPPQAQAPQPAVVPPTQPRRLLTMPIFWLGLFGVLVLQYGVAALFIPATSYENGNSVFVPIAGVLTCGVPIALLIAGSLLLRSNRPLALGLLYGLLVFDVIIPFVGSIILFGICVTSLGSM